MYLFLHNSDWKSDYQHKEQALQKSYTEGLTLFHIGSTVVKGLDAKDCIDILAVVCDLRQIQTRLETFTDLGYRHRGENGIDEREYFSKSERKVHLHIYGAGNFQIELYLNFVRVMRNSPRLVKQLNSLKRTLHQKYPNNKDLYQTEKAYFYKEIHKMF